MSQDDPVVQRVREARRRIIEQCGNDPHRLYEWAKRIEAEFPERVVGYEGRQGKPSGAGEVRAGKKDDDVIDAEFEVKQ